MKTRPSLLRNTSFLVMAQAIRVAAQALFLIAVRRHLSTAEFGGFSVAFVLGKLLTQFAELGFSTTLLRDASRNRSELRSVLGAAIGLRSLTSLFVIFILVIAAWLLPYPRAVALATVLFGLSYLAQSFCQLFFAALRSHERVYFEPLALLTYAVLLLVGIAVVIRRDLGLVAIGGTAAIAQIGALVFIITAAGFSLRDHLGFSLELSRLRSFWRSCWPVGAGTIGYLIYYQADTILLYFMRGDVETGIYNTAYQLVAVSLILPVSYFNAMMPRLVEAFQGEDHASARKLMSAASSGMLMLGLPLAVGTGMIARELLQWLFPLAGTESVLPLQLLIWLAAISYWGQTYTNAAIVIHGARIYMRLSILGGIINLVANLMLIPYYGYLGACATTLATELLINSLFYRSVVRRVGSIPFRAPFIRALLATAVMAVVLFLTGSVFLPIRIAIAMLAYALGLFAMKYFHYLKI